MSLTLEIVEGPEAGRQIPLDRALDVGRSAEVDLTLDDEQASRRHARIELAGDGAVVTDLGSSNGTFVNDQSVEGARPIRPGDQIRVGLSVLQLRSQEQIQRQASAVLPIPTIAPVGPETLGSAAPAAPAPAGPNPFNVGNDPETEEDPAYKALATLVDTSVKQQTRIATFALLSLSALAVLIYFGVR
jgi:pSer/pThr/pTyr-binding forkhead associated (FHA) protein